MARPFSTLGSCCRARNTPSGSVLFAGSPASAPSWTEEKGALREAERGRPVRGLRHRIRLVLPAVQGQGTRGCTVFRSVCVCVCVCVPGDHQSPDPSESVLDGACECVWVFAVCSCDCLMAAGGPMRGSHGGLAVGPRGPPGAGATAGYTFSRRPGQGLPKDLSPSSCIFSHLGGCPCPGRSWKSWRGH